MKRASPGSPLAFLIKAFSYEGTECLIWPYAKNSRGYGHLIFDGIDQLAHRIICEKINGPPLTADAEATHSCGNGHLACIAKNHLRWKSHDDNMKDMIVHGRSRRGKLHHNTVLTEKDARYIKANVSTHSIRKMSLELGVSYGVVWNVANGITWVWLDAGGIGK